MDELPRLPFGGAAFALEFFRPQPRSAAMPLAPSSRGRPSPDVRAYDRALPSLRQERRPLSAPSAFARNECAASYGRFRDRNRLRPPPRIRSAFARRRRSFCVHSTKVLVHLRQSPDSAL